MWLNPMVAACKRYNFSRRIDHKRRRIADFTGYVLLSNTISHYRQRNFIGTAYILADAFEDFIYNPNASRGVQGTQNTQPELDLPENTAIEIPLNTLVECLNIFGSVGSSSTSSSKENKVRRWRRMGEDSDHEANQTEGLSDRQRRASGGIQANSANNSTIDQFFGTDKGTGMRISYVGAGYPVIFMMYVLPLYLPGISLRPM